VAEDSFQEKLWDALGDDDRLDAVEARLKRIRTLSLGRWRGLARSKCYAGA